MASEQEFQRLEEQFWKGDADFYRRHLDERACMVFAEPVGTLTREEAIRSIADAPRWADVRLHALRALRLAEDVALVTYQARAVREGEAEPYTSAASSAYVRRDGAWKLAFHQQTPHAEG
jgi:hypothetical protein